MPRNRERRGWNPWRALREDPTIELAVEPLPDRVGGAYYWRGEGWAAIAIDSRLTATERNARLAHELVHHERGGGVECAGMPEQWHAVVDREERRVHDETARRLVPSEALAALISSIIDDGRPVEAWEVADAFDVPEHVARRALELLRCDASRQPRSPSSRSA